MDEFPLSVVKNVKYKAELFVVKYFPKCTHVGAANY